MKTLILLLSFITIAFNAISQVFKYKNLNFKYKTNNPIKVLNIGTFHMGYTPDAHSLDFDEHDKDNIREIQEIAKKIAKFKPTIILVERDPRINKQLQSQYAEYLTNPNKIFKNSNEINLLAFEVGRLANTTRIFGIDHSMPYYYMIGDSIKDSKDQEIYNWYVDQADSLDNALELINPSILERLIIMNQPFYLDFLLNINADILTHISHQGSFEGADEAAKYYNRNLRMYSNLNQIEMNEGERIFILLGASHTAFFNQWLNRSPKYKVVNTFDYLN